MLVKFLSLPGQRKVRIKKKGISIFLNTNDFDSIYNPTSSFKSREYAWGFVSAHNQFDIIINESSITRLLDLMDKDFKQFKADFSELMEKIGLPIDIDKSELKPKKTN
jgi:hypothetical protein